MQILSLKTFDSEQIQRHYDSLNCGEYVSSVHSFESSLPSIALIFGDTFYGRTDKFFQAEVL